MKIKNTLLAAAFVVPLQEKGQWQSLEFSRIPANKVEFSQEKGLNIAVNSSASPLIFPLPEVKKLSAVEVKGEFQGQVKLKEGQVQGDGAADDYIFRLGLVLKGEQRLNFVQRRIAAKWIRTLFDLAPPNMGVDHILFLNVGQMDEQVGRKRAHPLSDLLKEHVVWKHNGDGPFEYRHEFDQPVEVVALWLSSDGDDTKSSFKVNLSEIRLHQADSGEVKSQSLRTPAQGPSGQ